MKGEEKRREIRIFVSLPVIFHGEQDQSENRGDIIDLSLGGMSLKTGIDLKVNDTIKVKFEIPTEMRFIFLGKIITSRVENSEKVFGVKFIKQDPVDRLNLSEYIMQTRSEQEFWIKDNFK
ncbi:MAG: PilZ domain-containing protein [bacterium]